jgi:Xaa-Pro aminopeptidase
MIAQMKREKLSRLIPDKSIIILEGGKEQLRNGDIYYPFRQNSSLLLLTQISSPDIILVGEKRADITSWTVYSDTISSKEILW